MAAREQSNHGDFKLPAEIDWNMLDKSRFFVLGAALFSAVSGALYPAVVLKTRQQVSVSTTCCSELAFLMLRREGLRSFYRGFATSLTGTVPARALYMTALEITKTTVAGAGSRVGLSDTATAAVSSATAGLSASIAAQLVWTPVDVVSQRMMVAGKPLAGADCLKKIVHHDGIKGLYRGFGVSILTYAPSSALWWGSYSLAYRIIRAGPNGLVNGDVAAQGAGAAVASGVSALVTMPLDTVKTRLQVAEGESRTVAQTVAGLVREGGIRACYRGFGPRWASMSMSSATMVTTYELLKKLSTKHHESYRIY
ncbi:hypothetical protein V2J09_010069 [Rumex salicifolius]